jgi:hypothetical protein
VLSRRSNGGEILRRSGMLKTLQSSRPTSSHELNCNACGLFSNVPLVPVFHQWLRNLCAASHEMPSSAQDVGAKFKRFRILVVGRANVGKTTILRKVYHAIGKPEIFDGKEHKVDPLSIQHRHYLPINHDQINADVVKPSVDVCTYA